MTVVGRVAALWRYPVKSMAAEELQTTRTLASLGRLVGTDLAAERFRPNRPTPTKMGSSSVGTPML